MGINFNGMFFGRANLGMQKAMNSLAAVPLSFPQIRFSAYGIARFFLERDQNSRVEEANQTVFFVIAHVVKK